MSKKLTLNLLRKFNHGISQPQNMKRFYKESTFVTNPIPSHPMHRYLIKLDDKTMKTPYRHLLAVPSPTLALLITSQFNRQDKYLKTGEMPMLSLCRTAVDADIQGNIAEYLKNTIIEYLLTDTLNFYEDYYEEQYNQHARPLVEVFSKDFSMPIVPSCSLQPPVVEISQQFTKWINSLNNWQLIGFETMTIWLKSTISAYNMIKNGQIQKIQHAATLQEITQMKNNGIVEEKLMHFNQIKLMVCSGLMIYQHGGYQSTTDIKQ